MKPWTTRDADWNAADHRMQLVAVLLCSALFGCGQKQSAWPAEEAQKIRRALRWSAPPPTLDLVRPPGYEPEPRSPYDELLDRELREGEVLAIQMIAIAVKLDSDLPRQLRNAARELGADPETAARNIDAIRLVARQRKAELERGAAYSPTLQQQIRDPEFAELAHEGSRPPLGSIPPLERIARHWTSLLF